MRKIKLLSATALSVMLAFSANAVAAGSFDDASEEEIAKAVVSVLKKNPQIAYDALVKFRADADTKKAESEKELTPLEQKVADVLMDNPPIIVGALQIYQQQEEQKSFWHRRKPIRNTPKTSTVPNCMPATRRGSLRWSSSLTSPAATAAKWRRALKISLRKIRT